MNIQSKNLRFAHVQHEATTDISVSGTLSVSNGMPGKMEIALRGVSDVHGPVSLDASIGQEAADFCVHIGDRGAKGVLDLEQGSLHLTQKQNRRQANFRDLANSLTP